MTRFGLLVAMMVVLHGNVTIAEVGSSAQKDQNATIVTGTLAELDLSRMKGKIQTDLGKPVFFEVMKPELFKGLSVGEHVTVQIDGQGRATKVIDTPIPELQQPMQPGQ